MRLSETLDDFKRSMVVSGSRLPNTTEKYERIMRQFINVVGDKEIHELRVGDFGDFKYGMVLKKMKTSTVATAVSVFSKYASYLKRDHSVKDLDIEEIRMMRPKVHQTSPEALEKWEVEKLYEAATDIGDKALVHLLFYTGVRISELLKLRAENICDRTVQSEDSRQQTTWIEVVGKGEKPREIPLSINAEQILRKYMTYLDAKNPDGYRRLFPRSYSTYWRRLQHLGEQANVKVSPHVLRHSFGVELIDKGENIRRVAELMGHSDMNTTMRYTAVKDKSKVDAVNKL